MKIKNALLFSCPILMVGFAQTASAITLYGSPTDRLIFSGRFSFYSQFGTGTDHDDHSPHTAGTRARVVLEHNFGNGWTALGLSEWGFDPLFKNGEDHHFKRQQYVGLASDRYGTLLAGQQYSLFYSMVGVFTDYYWINGTAAQGSFNGTGHNSRFEGTGRPGRAVSYRNRIGDWSVGVLYQIDRDKRYDKTIPHYGMVGGQRVVTGIDHETRGAKRKNTIQGAVQWHASDDLTFGATYSHSNIERYRNDTAYGDDIDAGLIGVAWQPGNWYIAADAGEYRNLVHKGAFSGYAQGGSVDKARGYEFISMYNFKHIAPGQIQVYGGLNRLDDQDSDARNVSYLAGAAWLVFNGKLIFAAEQDFDDTRDIHGYDAGHNRTSLFVRYNF